VCVWLDGRLKKIITMIILSVQISNETIESAVQSNDHSASQESALYSFDKGVCVCVCVCARAMVVGL